jgi:hypothetical protein
MNIRHCFTAGLAAMSFAAAAAVLAAPAVAGGIYPVKERVHADSFGNLVIYSPAGYKRIVVGKGHLLDEYAARGAGPRVVYLEDEPYRVRKVYRCSREGVRLHGRSYMYGLPEHVVPVPKGICK